MTTDEKYLKDLYEQERLIKQKTNQHQANFKQITKFY